MLEYLFIGLLLCWNLFLTNSVMELWGIIEEYEGRMKFFERFR